MTTSVMSESSQAMSMSGSRPPLPQPQQQGRWDKAFIVAMEIGAIVSAAYALYVMKAWF